eukprot:CAMPEP_0202919692 /NCGR_PEP_ID=MMETSP1392-20130828/76466_1 /ASSEMBLY_ACC=CAM_ASM_000868 /TAXON_ID=225041 /ORGANISM="Chlamydomonas chlamydogama, Strain SAG 11-48b" /LENGTH=990 /DNA_ID=CAMNT_0049613149 /DNA_START=318 /DNA_END=3290 /DNA_ORIENTATION=+
MSKRKSPALVGIVNDERLLGEEAFSFAVRYPETTYARMRDLLGKPANDSTVTKMLKDYALPYEVVDHPNRTVASVKVRDGVIYSAEELVASILQYAKKIAEDQAGGSVPDAVIAVPAYFGQAQRQALLDAANVAGMNVLGLINTHTAAALQYGIERDFSNKTHNIILYDMGSGSTEVALIKYSSYNAKEAGKITKISQLEVKDVDWDHELGANLLDQILSTHFVTQFAEKHKLKVETLLSNAKAMAKMKKQVRRTKEILSANTGSPFSVEEFYDGKDFQSSITREEFETLAADFFKRAAAPLVRVLERSGLKPEEIEAVELLGGGSRVPKLQAVLSEALGGRALDRHLDADEASVLGAGLFAANLSTSFRLRRFGMTDLSMYGIQLRVDELHDTPADPAAAAADKGSSKEVKNLLPYMKKLPIKRIVHFSDVQKDPIRIVLTYNTTTHHGMPPGVTAPDLAAWEITGIDAVIKRYNTSGLINLRFEADLGGVVRFDKAEAVVDYEVMEEKIIEIKEDANTTASSNSTTAGNSTTTEGASGQGEGSTAGEGGASGEEQTEGVDTEGDEKPTSDEKPGSEEESAEGAEEAAAPGPEAQAKGAAGNETVTGEAGAAGNGTDAVNGTTIKRIMVPRRKTARVALTIGGPAWFHPSLSGADFKLSQSIISAWVKAEAIKRETAAAKNDLESYIIKTREKLETDDRVKKVTTEELRVKFTEQLTEMEDWLYMDGDNEQAVEYRKRLRSLKEVGDPINRRAQELEMRPQALEDVKKQIDLKLKTANAWADSKPWINETDRAEVIKKLEDVLKWVEDKEAEQAKKADHEDPVFTVDEIYVAFEKVEKQFNKINNKKKPKPPPEPPAPNAGAGNDTAGNNTDTGAGAQGGKQEGQEAGKEEAKQGDSKQDEQKGKEESQKGQEADPKKGKKEDPKKGKKEDPKKGKKEDPKKAKKDDPKKAKKEDPKQGNKEDPKKGKKEDPKKGKKDASDEDETKPEL